MFIAALYFLYGIYSDKKKVEVIVVIVYVILSYVVIAVGQSSKIIVFLEYSFCCVSRLDAVLPVNR